MGRMLAFVGRMLADSDNEVVPIARGVGECTAQHKYDY